jgi:hypothetical protein
MELDYFYGQQADQFTFYRIPKILFTDERFCDLSMEAKVLYGILLDRMSLSTKSGWLDNEGRVYIIFTNEEVMSALGCGEQKATKIFVELEKAGGLIERKRKGLGKPSLIYVKNFASGSDREDTKSRFKNRETDPISSAPSAGSESDGMAERTRYRNYFEKTLGIRKLIERNPDEEDTITGMLDILVDTVCTKRAMIRVAGDDKPAEVVKGRLMKLEPAHISYVLQCLNESTAKVKNMRQYLLASLYNAPTTMSAYYQAMVNNDFANKEKKAGFNPAVELSYLNAEEQQDFMEAMDDCQNTPSLSQAQRIKKLSREGQCTYDAMFDIMGEAKKDELDKVTISNDVLHKYFPRSYTPKQMQDTIIKLLEQWQRKRQRDQSR